MKRIRRFLAVLLTLVLLAPAISLPESGAQEMPEEGGAQPEASMPEDWEAAELDEEYRALSMWMSESEGTVNLFDLEDNPLELEEGMRFSSGTILETEEESLAVVDMDRERLAIMDETSRAGFEKADSGDRISITLQDGAMYFRVGQPLEEEESFDVVMDDVRLAIRGTCGMVQQDDEGLSVVLGSGHAVITRVPEGGGEPEAGPDVETAGEPAEEPEEITIAAGEIVSVAKEETEAGIHFEKKKLAEDEVPVFLLRALERDPEQLEKVCNETGWQTEALFSDRFYMDIFKDKFQYLLERGDVGKYALVYLTEEDDIPSLLIVDNDPNDFYYIIEYHPESREVETHYFFLYGNPHSFYTPLEGKGLAIWEYEQDGHIRISVIARSEYGIGHAGKFYGYDDKGRYWYLQKEIDWTYVE